MKTSLVFVLFISFLITMLSLEVPSKESFNTSLVSYNPTPFKLEGDSKAAYFTFDNKESEKDIAIYFAKGNGFTVEVLFFENYDDIKVEENEYTGYKYNFKINNEKQFVFPGKDVIKTQYYIIVRDRNDYFYSDYITIFNENDIATLNSNSPFQIKKFYSGKKYTFEFDGKEGEKISLNVVNSDIKFNHIVKITTEDGTVFETKESTFTKVFDCTASTKFTMEFTSNYTAAEGEAEKKNIIIYKTKSDLIYLTEDEINSVTLINSQQLNYVKDITEHADNEESVVTFFIDYTMTNKIDIFCNVVPVEDTEEKIKEALPDSLSTLCKKENAGESDTYFHIYFKRRPGSVGEGKKLFLLLVAKVNTNNEFIIPKKFDIAISKHIETIDTDALSLGENRFTHSLTNYVPYFYRINLPTTMKHNFVVFNEAFRITSFIKGNLLVGETEIINTNRKNRRLFSFGKDITTDFTTLTIMVFGSIQQSILHIIKLEEPVTFLSDFTPESTTSSRPSNIFSFDMVNCKTPSYIVGNYETVSTSIIFKESFYGNFQVYYKKAIDSALGESDTVLPTSNDTKLEDITTLDTELDLIYITCTSPGRMDLHIFDSTIPNEFAENSRTDLYITEGNDIEVTLPKSVKGKTIYIEAMSPYKVGNIAITVNEEHVLTPAKPYEAFAVAMPTEDTEVKALISTEKSTILRMRLSTEGHDFIQVTNDLTETDAQYAFIKLDNKKTHSQIDVVLEGIKNNFYYEVSHLTTIDGKYINLPQYSGIQGNYVDATKLIGNKKTFSFSNPKGKYKSDFNYYLIIQLENSNLNAIEKYNIKYVYRSEIPTTQYEKIEPLDYKMLLPQKTLELNQKKDEKEEDIVYATVNCGNSKKSIKINYYNDNLGEINVSNKYQAGILKNTYLETHIIPEYEESEDNSGIYFTFVTKAADTAFYPSAITQFNSDKALTIEYKDGAFTWNKTEQVEEYKIYILNKTSNEKLNNLCYLNSLDPKATVTNNSYNFTTTGNYSVNVVAKVKHLISFTVAYEGKDFEIGSTPVTPPKDYKWLWITLSIIVLLILIAGILICLKKKKLSNVQLSNDQPLMGGNGTDPIVV